MPNYLWSAKDPDGRVTGQMVEAATPEDARSILEGRGFTELELQSDDFGNAMREALRKEAPELDEACFTADEELAFRRDRGFWLKLWRTMNAWSWALVPLLLWNAWNAYRGMRWNASCLFAALLLGITVYYMVTSSAVSVSYNRLLHAVSSGRWTLASGLIRLLRFLRWFNGFGVPRHEIIYREAQVIFERSGLEPALKHYQPCKGNPGLPEMFYWSRVAHFYFSSQKFEEGMSFQKRSFESGHGSASEFIDRAYHLVHYGLDPRAAREALAETEGKEIMALARSYLDMVQGMISLRESKLPEARKQFESALAKAGKNGGTPLIAGHIRLIKAYLCLVCARLGEVARSKKLFTEVARYLKVQHELRLLEECRMAVGGD